MLDIIHLVGGRTQTTNVVIICLSPFPVDGIFRKLGHMLEKFFGNNRRLLWCEPPYSKQGKQVEVYHYRLFCDENWQPIMPRGEVYSKQFTELGWKSYSELHSRNQ